NPRHRCCRDQILRALRQDHAAFGAAGQGGDRDMAAHRRGGGGGSGGLASRADFGFVGKEDVDMLVDEVAESFAVTADAEWVGKAESHLAPGGVSDRCSLA